MGLLDWLGHNFSGGFWNRFRTECRECGTLLKRSWRGELTHGAMLLLAGGLAFAITATFGIPPGPYNVVIIAAGLLGGTLAHYPIARYELANPRTAPELPEAQASIEKAGES